MFKRLFGSDRSARRAAVDALYEAIVAAARQPVLYSSWGVPDTPLGRFEMLSLHVFLFMHRVRGEGPAVAAVAQDLTDEFFRDIDHSIRELGISDVGVPKRMKRLSRMFYGRVLAYDAALDAGDRPALAAALSRNVRPEAAAWPEADRLAAYALASASALGAQAADDIASGRMVFPAALSLEPAR